MIKSYTCQRTLYGTIPQTIVVEYSDLESYEQISALINELETIRQQALNAVPDNLRGGPVGITKRALTEYFTKHTQFWRDVLVSARKLVEFFEGIPAAEVTKWRRIMRAVAIKAGLPYLSAEEPAPDDDPFVRDIIDTLNEWAQRANLANFAQWGVMGAVKSEHLYWTHGLMVAGAHLARAAGLDLWPGITTMRQVLEHPQALLMRDFAINALTTTYLQPNLRLRSYIPLAYKAELFKLGAPQPDERYVKREDREVNQNWITGVSPQLSRWIISQALKSRCGLEIGTAAKQACRNQVESNPEYGRYVERYPQIMRELFLIQEGSLARAVFGAKYCGNMTIQEVAEQFNGGGLAGTVDNQGVKAFILPILSRVTSPPSTPQQCPQGWIGTYPNCVPPQQPGSPPPQQPGSPPPQQPGSPPPQQPQPPPQQCPQGWRGTYPNCVAPDGTQRICDSIWTCWQDPITQRIAHAPNTCDAENYKKRGYVLVDNRLCFNIPCPSGYEKKPDGSCRPIPPPSPPDIIGGFEWGRWGAWVALALGVGAYFFIFGNPFARGPGRPPKRV